ncbi:MAG TPA: trypsin-like peptidase domain-containing protein [Symbiobacteriaceae bacterium]|jgi:S1-C subfamily serine protease
MLDDSEKKFGEEQAHTEPSAEMNTSGAESNAAPQDPVMELPEIPGPVLQAAPVYPESQSQTADPAHRSESGWKKFAAAVALVAVGAGVGSATTWGFARQFVQSSMPIGYKLNQSTGAQTVAAVPGTGTNVIPGIYQRVSPAVVAIHVKITRGYQRGEASGSGFVVDSKGYILTNNHVIEGGTDISVEFVDGTVLKGTVVGADARRDLAVVKVDPGNRSLVTATLGDSDAVQVGELAIAIGSPFDQEFTVTAGIISAINRDLQEENNPWTIQGGIQTDAAINPGNSGGPLLDGNGNVIGINTLIETGDSGVRANVGIGFAVPINAAKEILPTLMSGKAVEYAFLGINPQPLTPALVKQFNLSVDAGVYVNSVTPDSPADVAGLVPARVAQNGTVRTMGDIITAMDGKAIKKPDDVYNFIAAKKVGDTITLTVLRGKETLTLKATLAARPKDQ